MSKPYNGSKPLEYKVELRLLEILESKEVESKSFRQICNTTFDSNGEYIFGPPGPGLRQKVQLRRDYLVRYNKARNEAIKQIALSPEPHRQQDSPSIETLQRAPLNISSPPPKRSLFVTPSASKPRRSTSKPRRTMSTLIKEVDGEEMPCIPLVIDRAQNVGGILAIRGRNVRANGGRLVDKLQISVPIHNRKDFPIIQGNLSSTGHGIIGTMPVAPYHFRSRDNTDRIQAICDNALNPDESVNFSKVTDSVLSSFQAMTTEIAEDRTLETMKVFFEFEDGITCNNECFNVNSSGNNPSSLYKLITKCKMEKDVLGQDEDGNMIVSLMPFIVWEVAIDSTTDKDKRTELQTKGGEQDILVDAMAGLGIKLSTSSMEG